MSVYTPVSQASNEDRDIYAYEIRAIEIETTIVEERKSQIGEVLEKQKHPLGNNCVFYVKQKLAQSNKTTQLPSGLTNLKSKIDLINTNVPHVGDVVITDESEWGHLSIVLEVRNDSIVIEEGNYIHGFRTVRVISKDFPLGYST